jgi:hypothetical protein
MKMTLSEEKLPENMTRVLCEHRPHIKGKRGTFEFAFYKDGMFKFESSEQWVTKLTAIAWISIKDLESIL